MVRSSSPDLQADVPMDGAFGVDCANAAVTVVKTANRQRVLLVLTNPSDTDMFLGFGEDPVSAAATATGIFLAKAGGSITIDNWTGDVRCRHEGAAPKRITGTEI